MILKIFPYRYLNANPVAYNLSWMQYYYLLLFVSDLLKNLRQGRRFAYSC